MIYTEEISFIPQTAYVKRKMYTVSLFICLQNISECMITLNSPKKHVF